MENTIFARFTNIDIDEKERRKMIFIMNALDDGWSVCKTKQEYIFKKKHKNLKEVYNDDYLKDFLMKNAVINDE